MTRSRRLGLCGGLVFLLLAGCISTQELPLAPNSVRIDTQAQGVFFTGQTVPQTMRAAARATLDRGYSHFRLVDTGLSQGSMVTGTLESGTTTVYGNVGPGSVSANATGFGGATLIHAPTASAAVTVVMFHETEAGAGGAFDARQILRQYAK